ncbi:MAG: glycosyltransferase family 39 protein, partial [Chloroflexi bacterium]|nr:glycosyltransferase family 39 protein [Chloroflexota bacterium]
METVESPENQDVTSETAVPPPPPPPPEPKRPLTWESFTALFLLAILMLAAFFRFSGLNWDANYHLHPDERFLTMVGTAIQGAPDPVTYLTTSESPLNPYNVGHTFFVYGNFPMTAVRYIAEWSTDLCTTLNGTDGNGPALCDHTFIAYDGIQLMGRFLSGFVDLIAVAFTFLIGRRLYNWRVGLFAALLHAVAVMPIQQSHFFTMDNWAAAFTTMTVYTAVRAARFGDKETEWQARWWVLFGVGLGIAAASRINVAPVAGIAVV